MGDLASYLTVRKPDGMSYPDAVQLCLRLYCAVDGVPKKLLPLSKEVLGAAFATLGRAGWVRSDLAQPHDVSDPAHWIGVMLAIFKYTRPDMERGAALARQVGFVTGRGVP
jgi:hypothetical protein